MELENIFNQSGVTYSSKTLPNIRLFGGGT